MHLFSIHMGSSEKKMHGPWAPSGSPGAPPAPPGPLWAPPNGHAPFFDTRRVLRKISAWALGPPCPPGGPPWAPFMAPLGFNGLLKAPWALMATWALMGHGPSLPPWSNGPWALMGPLGPSGSPGL